jgi:tetratricopeptide (TPR) repeat protein
LEEWYSSLTSEQQEKLKLYSGEGEDLIRGEIIQSSQTQQGFFGTAASNADSRKDYEFAVFLAKRGLESQGTLVDQHYIYNALIEAYRRQGSYEDVRRYCLAELEGFQQIGKALKREFGGELPSSIPCRDTLIDLVRLERDYDGAKRFLKLFVQKGLLSGEEADDQTQELETDRLQMTALALLERGDFEEAKATFAKAIQMDESHAAEIYKTIGKYFLKKKMEDEALDYLRKAVAADPMIRGVKSELKKLSKKLNVDLPSGEEEVLKVLRDREERATEWWAKRDLGIECTKLKQYDRAWGLFNEAIMLRHKQGMPCDTIYPHMAQMREKENRPKDAMLLYLLAYRELQAFAGGDLPKYVSQGIDRCLKKLGLESVSHVDLCKSVTKNTDSDTIWTLLQDLLDKERPEKR